MGCSSGKQVHPGKLEHLGQIMKDYPVRLPSLPGDVLVSGDLPKDVVIDLAGHCKGWLYLNQESDPAFMEETIRSKGAELHVVPFKPSPKIDSSVTEQVVKAISELPRPLMIQCTSANRAAIALLLWMAQRNGYTGGSAEQLVKDLAIDTVRPEAQGWLQNWLPSLEKRSTEAQELVPNGNVQQLFDPETSTLTYLLSCPETNEAVLIDPVLEQLDRDLKVLKDAKLTLKYVPRRLFAVFRP